jgi:acyl carrier protein
MDASKEEIANEVRRFIAAEFLPPEEKDLLQDDTPLMSGGILDSISTVKLVAFMEQRFGVGFEAHEIRVKHFDTVQSIAELAHSKLRAKP